MANVTFGIDLDKPCPRCKKPGSVNGGLCLACIGRGIKRGEFDEVLAKHRRRVKSKLRQPGELGI